MRKQSLGPPVFRSLIVVVAMVAIAVVPSIIGVSRATAGPTPTTWVGGGPSNFTVNSNGSAASPQLNYNLVTDPQNPYADETWLLSTTATSDATVPLTYAYSGFHAYYEVVVHLDAFVTHNGVTTKTSLVHDGPINCCTAPSGGFSYTGSHSFVVATGDTYGFTVGGSNFDSNHAFYGTLTVNPSAPPVPYTDQAAVDDNTSWTNAAPLTTAGADGSLLQPGEARWYKFPIQPDGQVQVDLTHLDQNFDLTMFRDINQAFVTVANSQDLTKLSVQFAGDAYSPSIYSPSIYSPSIYSPSIYSPSIYSPSIYSPSIYSPSIYSPSIYSPSIYSPSIYSPSIYSPSIYSPSIYSPSLAFLAAFSSAQTRSLIGVSANDNAQSESIRTATWNNTGNFYVRVAGRNGASSPNPFHLALSTLGGPCSKVALKSFSDQQTLTGMAGSAQTVVLTDTSRIGQGTGAGLQTALSALAGKTGGAVVDVSTSPRIVALNQQADDNTACPFAKNLVAQAIRDVVNSYRDSRGTLKYVVVAGGDSVIPFFRYADSAGIGPESNYVPPVRDTTASQASLRDNYVLGQDAYGSLTDVTLKGAVLPVPDLAVGRLVETPDEIQGMVNAFLALPNGVLPTPTSSLVTGYDFLTSAADTVQTDFSAGIGSTSHADSLITDQGVPTTTTTVNGTPSRLTSWTATDLSKALLGAHHDLVFLAGHFSANNTLAADYSSTLATTDLDAHQGLLTNSLVLSAGCHAGYNLLDADGVPGVTLGLDWAQEMARQKATFVAGTGYQYADTDFLAYSAKIYAGLADGLLAGTGPVGIGPALVGAKQAYLAAATTVTGIDQKALIEMTLYGLPMTALNLPHGRTAAPVTPAGITPVPVTGGTPGDALGLKTAPLDLTPHLTPASKPVLDLNGEPTGASFHWLVGDGGVHSAPGLPALPQQSGDVTSTTGEVLRGVGFVSGTYTDTPGVTPLTGAPTTEQNGVHTSFASSVFFPQKLATVNYFDALGGSGAAGRTRLITTPAQYRSDPGSMSTDTERAYSHVGLQLFYSANTKTYGSNTPALAAPPSISGVSDTGPLDGSAVTLRAHVTGDPSAGVQEAWVTYTAESGPLHGQWQSVNLIQDQTDSTLWTATFPLPGGQDISAVRYIVQAVNGVGLVGLDNNLGDGYTPRVPVGVATAPGTTPTSLTLGSAPASGVSGASLDVSATLTGAPQASPVTFSLGSTSITSNTNAGGLATATLPLEDAVGGYTLTALYGGDATYRSSTTSTPFSITKTATSLALSASGPADPIVATLSRTAGAIPLPQQTVFFTLTGPGPGPVTKVLTAATDPQGRAQVTAPALPDGVYSVVADFLGTPSTYMSSSSSSASIVVDTRAPTVTAVLSPPVNGNGWNNSDVTVTFTCGSGVSGIASCTSPVTVTKEGSDQAVTGTVVNNVGTSASDTALVSLDRTAPMIAGSTTTTPNSLKWFNASVTVHFTCTDTLSGLWLCPADTTKLDDGFAQQVSGVAVDNAGNQTTGTVTGINIDQIAPTVKVTGIANGATYPLGSVPTAGCSSRDTLSGVATASTVSSTRQGNGVYNVSCSAATDNAGNASAPVSASFTVTVDATSLASLTSAYITANHNSGAAWVSNNWNGKIQKLSNDLKTGKVCKFITDTQTEIGSTLTQTQANDLNYWAHLIDPTCKPR